jgi:GNAT superfamily N-acetyltransferase
MTVNITSESPDSADARLLIAELEAALAPLYPSENQFGYSVEKLIAQRVVFFVIRVDGAPAGCGGIQIFGEAYGEVKRMFVRPHYRGMGLAKKMLAHLEQYAAARNIPLLRLETGTLQHEAIRLYEQDGFYRIAPFADYPDTPLNVYYEKKVAS